MIAKRGAISFDTFGTSCIFAAIFAICIDTALSLHRRICQQLFRVFNKTAYLLNLSVWVLERSCRDVRTYPATSTISSAQ